MVCWLFETEDTFHTLLLSISIYNSTCDNIIQTNTSFSYLFYRIKCKGIFHKIEENIRIRFFNYRLIEPFVPNEGIAIVTLIVKQYSRISQSVCIFVQLQNRYAELTCFYKLLTVRSKMGCWVRLSQQRLMLHKETGGWQGEAKTTLRGQLKNKKKRKEKKRK